jgi:hypothetical protein
MTTLNNNWTLWSHNLNNNDWSIKGYKNIYKITTVEEFWRFFLKLNLNIIQNEMLFYMKNDIEPLWENKDNIDGGCWSYKISKKEAYISWIEICMAISSETLIDEKHNSIINGISISPKKNFCIVKIWTNNSLYKNSNLLSNNIYNLNLTACLFKAHKERN